MRYYYAPLEGITDSIYRQTHHEHFGGVDRYYMPFFSPTVHRTLTPRETRELPCAGSVSFEAVPQIMTKVPEDFLWAAQQCADRGYTEVNLNLGCPSGTVVSKGKGSGMLADPQALDRFLDEIYSRSVLPVSIKTRLGIQSSDEFPALLEIFNRYPVKELTLHPRVRKAFYSGGVDMQAFQYCLENSRNPVCYNGNLCTVQDIEDFRAAYPQVEAVMLGRGLVGDPGMLCDGGTDIQVLESFCNTLLERYTAAFGGSRNAMFRLKENWHMLIRHFENSEKLWKRLRKTTDLAEYKSITAEIFHTLPFTPQLNADW